MPPTIPTPVMGGSGGSRPLHESLLLALASQLPGMLANKFMQPEQPDPGPSVAEREADAQGKVAARQLAPDSELAQELEDARMDIPTGLGDAKSDPERINQGLVRREERIRTLRDQAPLELTFQRQAQAEEDALGYLAQFDDGGQLQQIYRAHKALTESGMDSGMVGAILTPRLPQTQMQRFQEAKLGEELAMMEDARAADRHATEWMRQQGLLSDAAGIEVFPGAGDLMVRMLAAQGEADARNQINWLQEGLDFVTARIGDNIGGTTQQFIMPGQGMPIGGDQAVSVDQAVAEWKSFIERFAPEDVREAEMARLEDGRWQRRLTLSIAKAQATKLFEEVDDVSMQFLRDILGPGFTPDEMREIFRTAQRRAGGGIR